MSKKEILKKVGVILGELNEQYEYLSKSSDNLNELELELFSANANFLSDHLSILIKLNSNSAKNTEFIPVKKEEVKPGEVSAEETTSADWKFELERGPQLNSELEEKETNESFDQPLPDDEVPVVDENTDVKAADISDRMEHIDLEEPPAKNVAEPEEKEMVEKKSEDDEVPQVKEVVIPERTIAVPVEQVPSETPVPTLNDLLSKSISQQTVSSQFNSRQSKDLKGMISLNDKLLFVRDLFNGYSLAYSEALELLNRFDSFEAADNFLKQNYALKNKWADKPEVSDKFYDILNRRFTK